MLVEDIIVIDSIMKRTFILLAEVVTRPRRVLKESIHLPQPGVTTSRKGRPRMEDHNKQRHNNPAITS
jgi:hypothetical protein